MQKTCNDYMDIIDHPRHESRQFPRMSVEKRAAQFAPFAALKGVEEAVAEAEVDVFSYYESEDRVVYDDTLLY